PLCGWRYGHCNHNRTYIISKKKDKMQHIKYSIDTDGIAFITWDVANSPVNIMNEATISEFFIAVDKAVTDTAVIGIIIKSAKRDFIAGGDLKWFLNYDQSKQVCFEMLMQTHRA